MTFITKKTTRLYLALIVCVFSSGQLNAQNDERQVKISNDSFINIVKVTNNILNMKDTSLLSFNSCVEILRVFNTIREYGNNHWDSASRDYIEISNFLAHIDLKSAFGKALNEYLLEKGEAQVSSGLGLYYSHFNIYTGGRTRNNSSSYILTK